MSRIPADPARIDNEANRIAARYDDDGQRFTAAGAHIQGVCSEASTASYGYPSGTVYEFSDGSALAVTDGGWDTVEWDTEGGVFVSVEPHGARNRGGWVFGAVLDTGADCPDCGNTRIVGEGDGRRCATCNGEGVNDLDAEG